MLLFVNTAKTLHTRVNINILLTILLFIVFSVFISFLSLYNSFIEVRNRIHYQSKITNLEVTNAINIAGKVLYGIARVLDTNLSEREFVLHSYDLIKNFDLNNYNGNINFSAIIITNKHNVSIATSNLPLDKFSPLDISDGKCLKGIKTPYTLNVGSLSYGRYSKTPILPLGISFLDSNYKYKGSLCTGLVIDNLNKLIERKIDKNFILSTKLNNEHQYGDFHFQHFLKSLYQKNNYIFYTNITNHPYHIELTLNNKNIRSFTINKLLFILASVFFTLALIVFFCSFIKKQLLSPYTQISSSIQNLLSLRSTNYQIRSWEDINKHIRDLYLKEKGQEIRQKKEHLAKKMFYHILVEDNFNKEQGGSAQKKSFILNHALYYLNKDEKTSIKVKELINNIIDHTVNFFDIDISHSSNINDSYKQKIKHSTFTEMVLQLFHCILRLGYFSEDNIKIESYIENQHVTILIKAIVENSSRLNTYRELPNWSLTSLYTVMLLAKENNYFLDILSEDYTVMFTLKSLSNYIDKINDVDFDVSAK